MKTNKIAKLTKFFQFGIMVLQAVAVVSAVVETYKKLKEHNLPHDHNEKVPHDMSKRFEGNKDIIDEASWESFPASDPPSFNRAKA